MDQNNEKFIKAFKLIDEDNDLNFCVKVFEVSDHKEIRIVGLDNDEECTISYKDNDELLRIVAELAISNDYLSEKIDNVLDYLM